MDLKPYFEAQAKLDEHIIQQKGLQGQDLLDKKILALQVELGELANEARFFKYWSEDTKPRTSDACRNCSGYGEGYFSGDSYTGEKEKCVQCGGSGKDHNVNPLLEEYADVIHFVIGLANDIGYTSHEYLKTEPKDLNNLVLGITNAITVFSMRPTKELMESILNNIIALGHQLGFDEKEVIEAYHAKNKENHKRQEVGY